MRKTAPEVVWLVSDGEIPNTPVPPGSNSITAPARSASPICTFASGTCNVNLMVAPAPVGVPENEIICSAKPAFEMPLDATTLTPLAPALVATVQPVATSPVTAPERMPPVPSSNGLAINTPSRLAAVNPSPLVCARLIKSVSAKCASMALAIASPRTWLPFTVRCRPSYTYSGRGKFGFAGSSRASHAFTGTTNGRPSSAPVGLASHSCISICLGLPGERLCGVSLTRKTVLPAAPNWSSIDPICSRVSSVLSVLSL